MFLVLMFASFAVVACNPTQQEKSEYEFSFCGAVTINEIDYDVVMNGKDGAFDLKPNNLPSFKGSYEFTAGKGYTFFFEDANGTEVRTQYDTTSQEFSFVYILDLGTARGSGNVRLTCRDTDFVPQGEAWADIPMFNGKTQLVINGHTLNGAMQVICKADGSFHMFSTDLTFIDEAFGTYEYRDGVYVFSINDVEYESVYNAETGLHEIELPTSVVAYNAFSTAQLLQVILTVD